ncbi:MAG: DUF192 domain-containing protein [Chromatiales bacterium]|nr:MAG: DUF192 domain-containing protein [Chromatiales bacterium]
MKGLARCLGWLAAVLLPASGALALEPAERVANFPTGTLVLETSGDRCLRINVRFADTPERQSQGLMFIEQMDEFEGMYFRYAPPSEINMWMKNTYIPLDMVFVRADQRIARIAFNTTPFSETRISSGGPVSGVLELNGGFAGRWRLRAGNRVLLVE